MSKITKKALAASLKKLLAERPLDKITVIDIVNDCEVNRQTFYYHFQDKYELVDWIYYNETISLIVNNLTYDNWNEKVLHMLTIMKTEYYFYENTMKASMEKEFREYLFQVTSELFCDIIGKIDENGTFEEENQRFIAKFYAYGIVGIVVAWVQHGMKETPEYIATQLQYLAYGTKKFANARYLQHDMDEGQEGSPTNEKY